MSEDALLPGWSLGELPLYVQAILSSGRYIMTPITVTQLRKDKYTGDEEKTFQSDQISAAGRVRSTRNS